MESRREHINAYVGKSIRTFRQSKGMTLKELAQHLEISYQQLQKYEKGTNRLSADRLYEVSRILGVSINYLLPGAELSNNPRDALKLIIGETFSSIVDDDLRRILQELMLRLTASQNSQS